MSNGVALDLLRRLVLAPLLGTVLMRGLARGVPTVHKEIKATGGRARGPAARGPLDTCCPMLVSPHHRMPFTIDSRDEGRTCVSMAWREMSARP